MSLSSKERLLRTIELQQTDYLPLCVLLWDALRRRHPAEESCVRAQLNLGIDPLVSLPSLAWAPDRRVEIRTWKEDARPCPLLHKRYRTPAGDLETVVEQTPDWPHGDDIPLESDFNIPRSRKFLVTRQEDLTPLEFLLTDPTSEAVEQFRRRAAELRGFANEHRLAVTTPAARLADTVCWLCGPIQLATWGLTDPDFLTQLISIIARWQLRQTEIYLHERPDIRQRAEWYASPFLSPELFDKFLGPALREDVELAHSAGAKYCYIGTANMMPFLPSLKKLAVDVLYGLDPIEGKWDFARAKAQCQGWLCLWGGMNGYLQVAHASPLQVEQAVRSAIETLAPGGGFILCPVDDIGLTGTDQDSQETWQSTWRNVLHMVEVWKELR